MRIQRKQLACFSGLKLSIQDASSYCIRARTGTVGKGTKRWRKEQKSGKRAERRSQINDVLKLIDEVSGSKERRIRIMNDDFGDFILFDHVSKRGGGCLTMLLVMLGVPAVIIGAAILYL